MTENKEGEEAIQPQQ